MDRTERRREREWRAGGDVEAEAAWIAQRIRAGTLSRAAVELAALLGHEAATTVAGPPSIALAFETEDAWCARVVALGGPVAAVRAAIAVGRFAVKLVTRGRAASDRCLDAAIEWARCPCAAHARRAFETSDSGSRHQSTEDAVLAAVRAESPTVVGPNEVMDAAFHLGSAIGSVPWERADQARSVIAAELVPWLLGGADPLSASPARRAGQKPRSTPQKPPRTARRPGERGRAE